jgi:hypothetical protein
MDRPFSANSPYSTTPTERLSSYRDGFGEPGAGSAGYSPSRTLSDYDDIHREPVDYPDFGDYDYADDYADDAPDGPDAPETDAYAFGDHGEFTGYDEEAIDRRWMWIAGAAGAILLVAIICTGVILGGGDSGSVSATIASPPTTTRAPAASSTAVARPAAPTLPAETVTTVPPSVTASAAPPPIEAVPAAPGPNTITYTVTGNRQLIDLVTVIYTDQQGALQTDVNVALPWSKTVVLDPGVQLSSVTATSVGGQLNCTISDAAGAPIVAQANNAMIATCTK